MIGESLVRILVCFAVALLGVISAASAQRGAAKPPGFVVKPAPPPVVKPPPPARPKSFGAPRSSIFKPGESPVADAKQEPVAAGPFVPEPPPSPPLYEHPDFSVAWEWARSQATNDNESEEFGPFQRAISLLVVRGIHEYDAAAPHVNIGARYPSLMDFRSHYQAHFRKMTTQEDLSRFARDYKRYLLNAHQVLKTPSLASPAAAPRPAGGARISGTPTKAMIVRSAGIDFRDITVPTLAAFTSNRAAARRMVAKSLKGVLKDDPIFFANLPPGISSSELVPGRISVRTFDRTARYFDVHLQNLMNVRLARPNPDRTHFFNFVVPPPEASPMDAIRWEKLRDAFAETAVTLGLQIRDGKQQLLAALESGDLDVVVVVAHGNDSAIFLPDGTTLNVKDVLALPPLNRERAPIVVLLSCETGSSRDEGLMSIAEALMLRGRATAVLAPTRSVRADAGTAEFLNRIFQAAADGNFDQFIRNLRGPWQVIVEERRAASDPGPIGG